MEEEPDRVQQREDLQRQLEEALKKTKDDGPPEIIIISDIDSLPQSDLIKPLSSPEKPKDSPPKIRHLLPVPSFEMRRLTLSMAEVKHIYTEAVEKQEEEGEKLTIVQKIMKYISMPIQVVAMLLIPNVDPEKIETWYSPLIPFTSTIGFLTILKSKVDSLQDGLSYRQVF